MNRSTGVVSLLRRGISTSQIQCKALDISKIKKKQMHFQTDNDVPVYLKGGMPDKVLFFVTVIKFLYRRGPKNLKYVSQSILRMSSTEEPPCPPPKPEPCSPQSPPIQTCPEPQPCPPVPQSPPSLCPSNPDPNNPCNYCPPPCIDPDYPDLTRLKKLQCKFQENNGIPIYLKGGSFDVFLFHTTVILVIISVLSCFYHIFK